MGQADIGHHPEVGGAPGLSQREPHFQRAESTGVLRAEVEIVDRLDVEVEHHARRKRIGREGHELAVVDEPGMEATLSRAF